MAARKQPHLGPKCPQIPLALDSGAHSMYNKFFSPKTEAGKTVTGLANIELADYGYYKSPEFRKYLDSYMEYIKASAHLFEFTVTLDIIFNPEASWEIYKEIRSNGLNVMPVYHFGEDVKWLKKYMDETDYVGIGGIGQQTTKAAYLPFGERTWKVICDAKGRPRVKTHGFAMSSFELMTRWPWYSVDSTTVFTFSRNGAIMLPKQRTEKNRKEQFNFLVTPTIVPVTDRRGDHVQHVAHHDRSGAISTMISDYLRLVEFGIDDVMAGYVPRDIANLHFMNTSVRKISEWHSERLGKKVSCRYYASGNPSSIMDGFLATLEYLGERDHLTHLGYLGTFYSGNRYAANYLIQHWHGEQA